MTAKVQLSPQGALLAHAALLSQGATRWPLPSYAMSYATGIDSRGAERPALEGAAECGTIRPMAVGSARPVVSVHLVVSGENLRDPRFCAGLETEAARP